MATTQRSTAASRSSSSSSGGGVTKSEFDGFAREVFTRFDNVSDQIKVMMPRELYEVRHAQLVADTLELTQRIVVAEKAINELGSQISTTRLATVNDTRGVERDVARSRYESLDRIYDLIKYVLLTIAGAVISYLITHPH